VITCEPTARLVVTGDVACPLPFNAAGLPRFVPPTLNCTVPVGVPAALVTVAVNCTPCPNTDGFTDDATAVLVAAAPTDWFGAKVPVLAWWFPDPAYSAVITCVPTASPVVLVCACPPLNATGLPRLEPFALNCTFPAGVPPPGAVAVTVAVNVTFWPNADGFADDPTAVLVAAAPTDWFGASVPVLA
jgi:hypothetical protein